MYENQTRSGIGHLSRSSVLISTKPVFSLVTDLPAEHVNTDFDRVQQVINVFTDVDRYPTVLLVYHYIFRKHVQFELVLCWYVPYTCMCMMKSCENKYIIIVEHGYFDSWINSMCICYPKYPWTRLSFNMANTLWFHIDENTNLQNVKLNWRNVFSQTTLLSDIGNLLVWSDTFSRPYSLKTCLDFQITAMSQFIYVIKSESGKLFTKIIFMILY